MRALSPALHGPQSVPDPFAASCDRVPSCTPGRGYLGDPVSMRRGREDDAGAGNGRAGCPCGRVARQSVARRSRPEPSPRPSRGSACGAGAGARAHAERGGGDRSATGATRAHRGKETGAESHGAALIGVVGAAALSSPSQSGVALSRSESSREQFHAALGPTGLVPGARGDATLTEKTSGWRIELDATGLPRPEDGRFTRRGSATPPARSSRSGRSTRDRTSPCGRGSRRRTSRSYGHARARGRRSVVVGRVLTGAVDTSG